MRISDWSSDVCSSDLPPSDQSTRAAVRRYLSGLMEARAIPGLQIAIVRNAGIELLDMMGLANIEHHVPVIRESIFSVNSMSKAFTRSEEHTSELQSLMRISYDVFCLKKKTHINIF